MSGINPEMSTSELMESFVPTLITSKLEGVLFEAIRDVIQIEITGVGRWIGKIENGKPTLLPGNTDEALITIVVSREAVEKGIGRTAGAIPDVDGVDVSEPAREIAKVLTQELADAVRAQVQGTIKFSTSTNDGSEMFALVGFNGINLDEPTCTVKTSESELTEMLEGGMSPQQAFMAGKIRLEGDMTPAMTLTMIGIPFIEPAMKFLRSYRKRR